MIVERPTTPPPIPSNSSLNSKRSTPLTPEQIRRIETNRLKAKAIYEEKLKETAFADESNRYNAAGQSNVSRAEPQARVTRSSTKRTYSMLAEENPATTSSSGSNKKATNNDLRNNRDGRVGDNSPLRPVSSKFANYIEYDFSKMTDTKGGFLSTADDPLSAIDTTGKPPNMPIEAWAKHLQRQKLLESKQGAFEPPLSVLNKDDKNTPKCYECGSIELDWKFLEIFKCRVCNLCREKYPDKYSLLTKTECKEDYLITDPELRDAEILPHMVKPNPHKSTWNNMQLFLRYQVEKRAVEKWGSLEALDKEFEKRQEEKKKKKDEKFRNKLRELKRKTRTSRMVGGGAGADGEMRGDKHEHVWGVPVSNGEGAEVRKCEECGLEIEELVF